ncbi:MAG: NAD(P)-dependent oxidoreductase [Nocardioidaceae bacterium]|nr:NAD(P)-dependent oxidoreductase [Nocardioidaceae bacterium]NUS49519.1 NAD(P)-dependent oxidoreductase [Nocardioidaceae bacterium]
MRVLVTGAAGSIGSVLCSGLADRGHEVVGLDRVPAPDGYAGAWFTADCADADAVEEVFAELDRPPVDAVVHLAGLPAEVALPEELESHLLTTAALLDAMVRHRVSRIVYASSIHAVGRERRTGPPGTVSLRSDGPPRADTFYGVAKVAAEALLRLYVDRHGLDAVATRIGTFNTQPENLRQLASWLSPDDAVRMFDACLTAPDPGYAVVYGVSANTRGWWDLAPGRALGYHPEDDAEHWATQLPAPTERDRVEDGFAGGEWALEHFHRPALDLKDIP